MRRVTMWLLLAALSISGAPAVALAHARFSETAPIETSRAALSARTASRFLFMDAVDGGALLLAAGFVIAGVFLMRRRRCQRFLVVALALLLACGGFEIAVHSVHHLDNTAAAERCLVASSAGHTHAVGAESPPASGVIARVLGAVLAVPLPVYRPVVVAPSSGRAPPA
jgi:hypothetical protein